ncbi:MAG: DUF1294 domain-containing protein [Acetivibrionales bacterium]|jgi:uncharacterized membrane protein YsdA (DUF1294 family)|nr:DUF1294 domain-containing protein [Clostridiaceae bacterium]
MELFSTYILIINMVAFCVSGFDKSASIHNRRRIPEKTLFILAIIGGSVGIYASMYFFRHKTKHLSFIIGIPAIILIQLALVWIFFIKKY